MHAWRDIAGREGWCTHTIQARRRVLTRALIPVGGWVNSSPGQRNQRATESRVAIVAEFLLPVSGIAFRGGVPGADSPFGRCRTDAGGHGVLRTTWSGSHWTVC